VGYVKRRKKMTKEFKVVLSYDVQRTIIVEANDEMMLL
jgi:hypothetical protein